VALGSNVHGARTACNRAARVTVRLRVGREHSSGTVALRLLRSVATAQPDPMAVQWSPGDYSSLSKRNRTGVASNDWSPAWPGWCTTHDHDGLLGYRWQPWRRAHTSTMQEHDEQETQDTGTITASKTEQRVARLKTDQHAIHWQHATQHATQHT
jgi:hypothetical protein